MKVAVLGAVLILLLLPLCPGTKAASQASFNEAVSAVQQAFIAVQSAGRDGGNITSQVVELNAALALIQKASSENSSNPAQASSDLKSALAMSQSALASAANLAGEGKSARQLQIEVSVISTVAIVGSAAAIYLFGNRVYRRIWLWAYKGHVVKKVG